MKNCSKLSKKGFNFDVHHYTTVRFYFSDQDVMPVLIRDIDFQSLKRLVKIVTKSKKKWFGNIAYRTENNGFTFIHLRDVQRIEFK